MATRVGIDLGTSTSEVAYVDTVTRRIVHVPFENQSYARSAVWFDEEGGRIVVGLQAYGMRVVKHNEVVLNIKREMGNPHASTHRFQGRDYTPSMISAEILKYLKEQTESQIRDAVEECVITVPAEFGTLDREHTQEAARLAGLQVLTLVPEPVAALVGHSPELTTEEFTAMVYDFGGGTFDCTVVRALGGRKYQVLSKAGARNMGGSHIDERIASELITPKVREAGFDLSSDADWANQIRQRILDAAEKAKISLGKDEERKSTWVSLPHLEGPDGLKKTVRMQLTQTDLDDLIAMYLRAANEQMQVALDGAGMTREELDMVILVGGATRLPAIRNAVRTFMGEQTFTESERSPAQRKVVIVQEPELLVARGAAVIAAAHGAGDEQFELVDILLHTVGLRKPGTADEFLPLLARGTDISEAKRAVSIAWPGDDTVALDVYEGEADRCTENKYVGTIQVGPAQLARGTPVSLEIAYAADDSLPRVTARDKGSGDSLPATVVYQQDSVVTAAAPTLETSRELDMVFCVDTTGSMRHGPYLAAFREGCLDLIYAVAETEVDYRFGAITFGDLDGGDDETVYSFTPDHQLFMTRLNTFEEADGGDEPESSLDAVQSAMRLPFRTGEDVHRRIVLVTDAPPQRLRRGTLESLVQQVADSGIRVDVLGPYCQEYDALTAGTGGRFFDIEPEDGAQTAFAEIIASLGLEGLAGGELGHGSRD